MANPPSYLPSLNSDTDDEEDAGRISKMTAALDEREDKIDEAVSVSKVDGKNKRVGDKEEDISTAEAAQEMVENARDGPEYQN